VNCPSEEIIQPLPSHNPFMITGIFILLIISAILIFELWSLKNKKPTVSKWFQRYSQKWNWFAILVGSGLIILAWHWIRGF
jgi:succinate dehydrogenase hydrophobic anchor subunit